MICGIICEIWASTCGNIELAPCINARIISTPVCTNIGNMLSKTFARAGASFWIVATSPGSAPTIPSAKALTISGAASRNAEANEAMSFMACGIKVLTFFIISANPFLSVSSLPSTPATRPEKPFITDVSPGSSTPTIAFRAPVIVPRSLVKLSWNAADDATASSLIIIPYCSASSMRSPSCFSVKFKSGSISCPDLPNRSFASAAFSVSEETFCSEFTTVANRSSRDISRISSKDKPRRVNFSAADAEPFIASSNVFVRVLRPVVHEAISVPEIFIA